jgi:hypothetical protein
MRSIGTVLGLLCLSAALAGVVVVAPVAPAIAHGGDPGGSMTYGPTVRGEVTQVSWGTFAPASTDTQTCCIIQVNGAPYNVPMVFRQSVEVGDIVNFDGVSWSIVRPSYATVPSSGR